MLVWTGSLLLQYLPPKRSYYLGQLGYVCTVYCSPGWMSSRKGNVLNEQLELMVRLFFQWFPKFKPEIVRFCSRQFHSGVKVLPQRVQSGNYHCLQEV